MACTVHLHIESGPVGRGIKVAAVSREHNARLLLIQTAETIPSTEMHPQTALCKRTTHMSSLLAISDHALYISHPSQSYNSICRTRLEEANDSARY